jgi:hypothetical protein
MSWGCGSLLAAHGRESQGACSHADSGSDCACQVVLTALEVGSAYMCTVLWAWCICKAVQFPWGLGHLHGFEFSFPAPPPPPDLWSFPNRGRPVTRGRPVQCTSGVLDEHRHFLYLMQGLDISDVLFVCLLLMPLQCALGGCTARPGPVWRRCCSCGPLAPAVG